MWVPKTILVCRLVQQVPLPAEPFGQAHDYIILDYSHSVYNSSQNLLLPI